MARAIARAILEPKKSRAPRKVEILCKGILLNNNVPPHCPAIWTGVNWRPGKFFFNYTISREEHKTIYSGLRISEIALSYQSGLPAFFSPQKVNLKIPINSGLRQAGIARPHGFRLLVSSKPLLRFWLSSEVGKMRPPTVDIYPYLLPNRSTT